MECRDHHFVDPDIRATYAALVGKPRQYSRVRQRLLLGQVFARRRHALRAVAHGTRKPDQRMFPQGSNFWFGIPSSAEW